VQLSGAWCWVARWGWDTRQVPVAGGLPARPVMAQQLMFQPLQPIAGYGVVQGARCTACLCTRRAPAGLCQQYLVVSAAVQGQG
jgi:hypothetical protein